MKGISTVIATLLMLVITVALAITAYSYIQGLFTTTTSKAIDIADSGCIADSSLFVTVRNLDQFNNISTSEIIVRVDDLPVAPVWNPADVGANRGTSSATIDCGGADEPTCAIGSVHRIRVAGPSGRAIQEAVSC